MNPTSIDICGPWQPINDTISSQAGFDFNTVNKAPGGLDVSGLGHPRPLQHLGISDLPMGGLQRGEGLHVQTSRPLVESSISDPIGIHIPGIIREKIWAGSYIELPLLLKQARDLHTDAHNTGELVIKNGQLVVARQHLRAITNIHTWTTAFIVYMSIYLEKFPGKAQEMLRYMHNVRLAAICPTLHMTLLIITLTRTFTPLNTAILTKLY